MTAQKHIIHKVKFNVTFGSQAAAMQGQQSFLQFFKKEISPALGALLDNHATEEELQVIDQLKIDLGAIPERPNWGKLSRLVLQKLEEQLTKKSADSNTEDQPRATLSKMEVIQNALLHYLEHGRLPTTPFAIQLAEDLLRLLAQRPQQLLWALQLAVSRSPEIVVARLSRQWEAKALLALVEAQAGIPQFQAFQKFFKTLKSAALPAPKQWEEAAWQAILFSLFNNKKAASDSSVPQSELPPGFLPDFLKRVFSSPLKKHSPAKEIRKVKHASLHQALEEYLTTTASPSEKELQKGENDPEVSGEKRKGEEHQNGSENGSPDRNVVEHRDEKREAILAQQMAAAKQQSEIAEATSSSASKAVEIPIPPGGLYCEMVGIVILHPFLNTYFKACGLLDDKSQFLSPEAAEKGVFLLYFLATGNTQAKEHELVFQKIMCGLPIAFPLKKAVEISAEEIAEGEKLIEAAINYWSALGKTSIAGLREGFLQRQGKISEGPEGWVLQVDRNTIDVLIDKIPWNISIIQFSWLDRLLRVEWT